MYNYIIHIKTQSAGKGELTEGPVQFMNWVMSLSYEARSLALIRDSAFLQLSIVPRIVMVLSIL